MLNRETGTNLVGDVVPVVVEGLHLVALREEEDGQVVAGPAEEQ